MYNQTTNPNSTNSKKINNFASSTINGPKSNSTISVFLLLNISDWGSIIYIFFHHKYQNNKQKQKETRQILTTKEKKKTPSFTKFLSAFCLKNNYCATFTNFHPKPRLSWQNNDHSFFFLQPKRLGPQDSNLAHTFLLKLPTGGE